MQNRAKPCKLFHMSKSCHAKTKIMLRKTVTVIRIGPAGIGAFHRPL